jgi:integrase
MPRNQGLTHRQAEALSAPGRYPDGRSLYLVVSANGKSWVFRYRAPGGKAREMGLGAFPDVSVADARRAIADARDVLKEGKDPIQLRDAKRRADIEAAAKLAAKGALTFGDYTAEVLPDLLAESANAKHRWAYARQLELHAAALNRMVLAEIRTADVAVCLKPIWRSYPETARRVRGRIERIMARAIVEGKHTGPNPATWQNNLEHAGLGRDTNKRGNVKHMAAVPYEEMPAFMEELRARSSISARALEFTILTAARTNEVVAAKWGEIDVAERLWTKPAEHMKGKEGHRKEHRVPLTDEAIALLKSLPQGKRNDPIFRNAKTGEPLSNWAMLECLKDLRPAVTVHGFRSSFSDYIGDRTDFDSRLVEFALAHRIENEVERAYRRGDAWERRRPVMEAWAAYLAGKSGNVVPLDRLGATQMTINQR